MVYGLRVANRGKGDKKAIGFHAQKSVCACAGARRAGAGITAAIHFSLLLGLGRILLGGLLMTGRQYFRRFLNGGFSLLTLHSVQTQMSACRYAGEHKSKNDELAKKTFDSAHT